MYHRIRFVECQYRLPGELLSANITCRLSLFIELSIEYVDIYISLSYTSNLYAGCPGQ